ncbi:MAG: hypothetical protein L0Y44_00275 [Phycisphaerales bacterium]|nr:hypothetical protein [Phycisphaerales bacterium]MCI0629072.1 hypothetical protein [Phycisphaerales bacterium]MCI0675630.1 hypothetical protein [Phycisphaerales bacterium]
MRSFLTGIAAAAIAVSAVLSAHAVPGGGDAPDSVALEPGSPIVDGGIAGGVFEEDFESGFIYSSGCNQQGWLCGPLPSNWSIVNSGIVGFGAFSARDTPNGSGVPISGEMQTPVFALTNDPIEADVVISNTASVFQLYSVNTLSGPTGFVNTRVQFEANGTITALQTNPTCTATTFNVTSGTWTPNIKMRIGFEVDVDGSVKVYKDGAMIFSGLDIAQICGAGDPDEGITQLRNYNSNVGTTTQFVLDNVGSPEINECALPLPPCRGDVTGDSVVNVSDLLLVISTWGQNGNPSGPRPAGDCAPLPNGDCLVNINDLLAVISTWGACPQPTGACCLFDASCVEAQTAAQCAAAVGVYQGNGTLCSGVTCDPFPINDECANAITVNDGANAVSNAGATNSFNPAPPGVPCTSGGSGNFTRDVWFDYTATCAGVVTIDLCATSAPVTDTVMAIYSGECAALTLVGCDDDSCGGVGPPDLKSKATVNVTVGQQLKIRVGSWQASPAGAMLLTIGCGPPDNDECVDAIPLAVGGSASGTLATAGFDVAPVCNNVDAAAGRWYTVLGNGHTLTASTCTGPSQTWNGQLSVYCGASCDALTCVTAANANTCNLLQETVSWCSLAEQTYWILVHTFSAPADGNYTLTISDGTACANPPPCAPLNDECSGAITVVNGINLGDNTGATTSAGIPGGGCAFQNDPTNFTRDVWFKYTATTTGVFVISTCDTSGSEVDDTVLSVLSGACGSLTELACDDDSCGDATNSLSRSVVPLTNGQQVLIRVGSWGTSPAGPFLLTIGLQGAPCTFTCPPGSVNEGETCQTNLPDTVNGGCNSSPTVFGTITPNGATICGTVSTFLSGAQNFRDTDWFKFTVSVAGMYHIDINAQFTAQVAIFGGVPSPGGSCVSTFQVPGSSLTTTSAQTCTTMSSPMVNLAPGNYAVVVTTDVFTGYPCAGGANNYWVRLLSP